MLMAVEAEAELAVDQHLKLARVHVVRLKRVAVRVVVPDGQLEAASELGLSESR